MTRDPDPYPHRMDSHCLWNLDPEAVSHLSKNSGASVAQNGAVEVHNGGVEAQNEAVEAQKGALKVCRFASS